MYAETCSWTNFATTLFRQFNLICTHLSQRKNICHKQWISFQNTQKLLWLQSVYACLRRVAWNLRWLQNKQTEQHKKQTDTHTTTGIYTTVAAFRATTNYSNCCKNTWEHSCREGRPTLATITAWTEDLPCQQVIDTHNTHTRLRTQCNSNKQYSSWT